MNYAVRQDLLDRYGGDAVIVTFDRDGSGVADPDAIERALSDASDEIDGYLAGRYVLPLATVPKILTHLCVDIALYKGSVGTVTTEEQRKRYEDAVRFLSKVAEGKIALGKPSEDEPAGQDQAMVSASAQIFSGSKLENY